MDSWFNIMWLVPYYAGITVQRKILAGEKSDELPLFEILTRKILMNASSSTMIL